jgi:hypothetical protein
MSHARVVRAAVLVVAIATAGGCARARIGVRPWQRQWLASPALSQPLARSPLSVGYQAKLLESRTGGGLPGVAAGGGCGCTQ